jgi:hypothetical protein
MGCLLPRDVTIGWRMAADGFGTSAVLDGIKKGRFPPAFIRKGRKRRKSTEKWGLVIVVHIWKRYCNLRKN